MCGPWQRLTPISGVPFGGTRQCWLLQSRSSAPGCWGQGCVGSLSTAQREQVSDCPCTSQLRASLPWRQECGGLAFHCRERPGLPVHPPSLHTCPGSPGATVHVPQIPHFPAMEMGSFLGMFNAGNRALVLISCGEGRGLIAGWPRRGGWGCWRPEPTMWLPPVGLVWAEGWGSPAAMVRGH